ncbi:MAG TPA: hypothetical protein VIQ74_03630 [Gemmatimonadaceae bacterium]
MAHFTRLRSAWGVACLALLMLLTACSPEQALKSTLPPDVPDPATQKTPAGALAAYRGALVHFRAAFSGFTLATSELADELQPSRVGGALAGGDSTLLAGQSLDARRLPEMETNSEGFASYAALHKVRGQAREALGALEKYAPDAPSALRGHLYALEGYAEVFLADLFCSGIPLSTLEFEGDHTYRAGSTTQEVYQHALALFDSALTLSADSARIVHLAQVGRARALLALGRATDAAMAVAAVPDGYSYKVLYSATTGADGRVNTNFAVDLPYTGAGVLQRGYTVAERKGGNGLAYISSNDPRVPALFQQNNQAGLPQYLLTKYAVTGDSPIVLADGVEARLIEAEAALQKGGTSWLERLNALRTDGTFTTQPNSEDSTKTDTLWHAGTGAVAGLAPLADPGTAEARIDLLFQERAFWLFVTGHRQGDMRRLVREYGRDPETVYPTGSYPSGGIYGEDVTAAIPAQEGLYNPKFAGCFHRGA